MGFHHVSGSNQFRRPGIVRGSRDGRMRKTGKNVAYHTAGYPGNGLLFIMGVGGLLSSGVEQIWLLRTPGNMSLADTLDVYVLRIGIQGGQFGYATAIGLIQGLVGLVLVVVCNRICKKITEVGLW